MSGFIGILNQDGAPVEPQLLRDLTESLAFRGPDGQRIWVDGQIGLGHALLRVTRESRNEAQPFHLDSGECIVADARVDGRTGLIEKLEAHGQANLAEASDVELILRAYRVWGENCVEHLLGDFSFAIWDSRLRRLFCARDPFGVKPFFYAQPGRLLLISNTMNCLRRHPAVEETLNESAIADFLLFGMHRDLSATSFAGIRRLPPAHTLTCESGNISIRRYWSLPFPTPIHYRSDEECLEQFRVLFDEAVADRMRTEHAGVLMSGGLDSTAVAASARKILNYGGDYSGLRAYTRVFDSLIPHEERRYSSLAAKALGIPVEYLVEDDAQIFGLADRPENNTPEPSHYPWPNHPGEALRRVASQSRVALTGYGADPAFSCRITVYFRQLLKGGRFSRALVDAARYLSTENRLSRLYLRTRWRILRSPKSLQPQYPEWLNKDLEKRLGLRERWETVNGAPSAGAPFRPEAHDAVAAPFWAELFESYDAGVTQVPIEVRHPFLDLRLVHFLLGLPVIPWCSDKHLLREAARGVLPDAVRLRRKSPLSSDPQIALLARPEAAWVDRFEAVSGLESYVDRSRIPKVHRERDSWRAWTNLRPLSLNLWLRQQNRGRTNQGLARDRSNGSNARGTLIQK